MVETSVKNEIAGAARALGLQSSDLRHLTIDETTQVLTGVENHFVVAKNLQWWWTDFRFPSTRVTFTDRHGYERLTRIVPDVSETVWFITEEDSAPYFLVYEANTATIQAILGQCCYFEYYVVAKDLAWLVCDTHHDVVIAIGDEVETRLRQLDAEQPGAVATGPSESASG